MKYKKCEKMLLDAGYKNINESDCYICRFRRDHYKVVVKYDMCGNVNNICCFDETAKTEDKRCIINTGDKKFFPKITFWLAFGLSLEETLNIVCGTLEKLDAAVENFYNLQAIEKL